MARYLLSVAELGRITRKSQQTVRRMIAAGELPFSPVEGVPTLQFRRVDVEAWLGCQLDERDLEVAS